MFRRTLIASFVVLLAACGGPSGAPPASTAPALPDWASALIGKTAATEFPHHVDTCVGYVDNIGDKSTGATPTGSINGWGWDLAQKAPYPRIIIVDEAGLIQGAGESTVDRTDVPAARPNITSSKVGFSAHANLGTTKLHALGVSTSASTVCELGSIAP